jgi:hypothetical protein
MREATEDPEGAVCEAVSEFLESQGWKQADSKLEGLFRDIMQEDDVEKIEKQDGYKKLIKAGLAYEVVSSEEDLEDGLEDTKKKILAAVKGRPVHIINDSDDGFFMVTLLLGEKRVLVQKMTEILENLE